MFSNLTKLSIRVIAIFSIAILATFVPEKFPDFFGDWVCEGSKSLTNTEMVNGIKYENTSILGCDYSSEIHKAKLQWGTRHYLYFWMGLTLFGLQIIGSLGLKISDKQKASNN